jgi:hypothetical protein
LSRAADSGVPTDDLAVDDIVRFRDAWSLQDEPVVAVVTTITADGPRLASPALDTPALARQGTVLEQLDVRSIIGLDETGAYHLWTGDAIEVVDPDGDLDHREELSREHHGRWIQHVDDIRGWNQVAHELASFAGGDES